MATTVNLRDEATGLRMLQKHPGESCLLNIDLTNALPTGVTVSAVTSVTPTAFGQVAAVTTLTVASPVVDGTGKQIQATYAAGDDGEKYLVEAVYTTSRGETGMLAQMVLQVTKESV